MLVKRLLRDIYGSSASLVVAFTICILLFQWNTLCNLTFKSEGTSIESGQNKEPNAAKLEMLSKVPTFGMRSLVANVAFLRFLQYLGDDIARATEGYELSGPFFDAIITHDPYYTRFYLFLSGSNSIYAADPEKSVSLMASGLDHLSPNQPSDSYYVWRFKGIDELLLLTDGEAAQQSFNTSADWAEVSQEPESHQLARLSRQTAQYLASNPRSEAAQVSAWSSVLTTATDENTRRRAIEKIESLGGSVSFSENGGISIKFADQNNLDAEG